MALGKAIIVGLAASIAIPYVARADEAQLGHWSRIGTIPFSIGQTQLAWSLPIFAGVTLFAWVFLSWAER
jgi:hypothetical protein